METKMVRCDYLSTRNHVNVLPPVEVEVRSLVVYSR